MPGFALAETSRMPYQTHVYEANRPTRGTSDEGRTGRDVDGSRSKMSGHAGTISTDIMRSVATTQTNGSPKRLSPERLAELKRPAIAKTPEEKRAALKRATEGLRVKVRVTPDMYGRR